MKFSSLLLAGTAFAAALSSAAPAMAAEVLTNGNFETGTFGGWTVSNQTGSSGSFVIDAPGTTTPTSGYATPANAAGGSFYAVTDQSGPGSHVLTQTFTIAAGTISSTLSYQFFAHNQGSQTTRTDLDSTSGTAGFYRVDILSATADAFSTASGDVVRNLVLSTGDSTLQPYQTASYSLNLAAGTYQLRFAEVDNAGFFNFGIDNVSIATTAGAVPEPESWAMMILGVGTVGGTLRRRKVAMQVSYAA